MALEVHKINSALSGGRSSREGSSSRKSDSAAASDTGSNTPNVMQDRVRLSRDGPKRPNEYAAANDLPT